jgi:hypothetical protein
MTSGRHYSVSCSVAEGVGLQALVTPPAVAIGPNGESLHTAQRATRSKPSQARNLGALVGGEGV